MKSGWIQQTLLGSEVDSSLVTTLLDGIKPSRQWGGFCEVIKLLLVIVMYGEGACYEWKLSLGLSGHWWIHFCEHWDLALRIDQLQTIHPELWQPGHFLGPGIWQLDNALVRNALSEGHPPLVSTELYTSTAARRLASYLAFVWYQAVPIQYSGPQTGLICKLYTQWHGVSPVGLGCWQVPW